MVWGYVFVLVGAQGDTKIRRQYGAVRAPCRLGEYLVEQTRAHWGAPSDIFPFALSTFVHDDLVQELRCPARPSEEYHENYP